MASTFAAGGHSASAVRRLYRELIRTAQALPKVDERKSALQEIREGFRRDIVTSTPEETQKLLDLAKKKLGYLKIVTPKRPKSSKSSFIFRRDGSVDEGAQGASPRTLRSGLDADDLARHKYLMERQHFGRR